MTEPPIAAPTSSFKPRARRTFRAWLPTLSRAQAVCVLAAIGAATTLFVGITLSPWASGNADGPPRGPCDSELYLAEIQRMHAGEPYYPVAAEELRSRGYPTASVFNWRTPLPMWLIAQLPRIEWGQTLLLLLAGATVVCGMLLATRTGTAVNGLAAGGLLVGALLPCALGEFYSMPELWAGTLICLSACALGLGWTAVGVAAGVAAMFCRDLAAPYAALALLIAVCRGRKLEASAWTAAIALYVGFFIWHAGQVAALRQPGDITHDQDWVQLGGAAFVISTVQMNGYLLVSPQWLSAVFLALALVGFASWNSPQGIWCGLASAAYLAGFAAIGQNFNQYWGVLTAPLLCLGVVHAPSALVRLWRTAWPNQRVAQRLALVNAGAER